MLKALRNLFLPEFERLERRITRLEVEVLDTLEDTKALQEKSYRLHQRIVKRAARAAEGEDGPPRPMSVPTHREEANQRILARRNRNAGSEVLHGEEQRIASGQRRPEG